MMKKKRFLEKDGKKNGNSFSKHMMILRLSKTKSTDHLKVISASHFLEAFSPTSNTVASKIPPLFGSHQVSADGKSS